MKDGYAVKIAHYGEFSLVPISRENERDFVASIQRECGGFFEIVIADLPVTDEFAIHVDEEGKLKGKLLNLAGTALYGFRDTIVGDVLIMPIEVDPESEYGEHDSMPMTKDRAKVVADLCRMVINRRLKDWAERKAKE